MGKTSHDSPSRVVGERRRESTTDSAEDTDRGIWNTVEAPFNVVSSSPISRNAIAFGSNRSARTCRRIFARARAWKKDGQKNHGSDQSRESWRRLLREWASGGGRQCAAGLATRKVRRPFGPDSLACARSFPGGLASSSSGSLAPPAMEDRPAAARNSAKDDSKGN